MKTSVELLLMNKASLQKICMKKVDFIKYAQSALSVGIF